MDQDDFYFAKWLGFARVTDHLMKNLNFRIDDEKDIQQEEKQEEAEMLNDEGIVDEAVPWMDDKSDPREYNRLLKKIARSELCGSSETSTPDVREFKQNYRIICHCGD